MTALPPTVGPGSGAQAPRGAEPRWIGAMVEIEARSNLPGDGSTVHARFMLGRDPVPDLSGFGKAVRVTVRVAGCVMFDLNDKGEWLCL